MGNKNIEFENLSYQDFYEDKILLIEYDLTPHKYLKEHILSRSTKPYLYTLNLNNEKFRFYYSENIFNTLKTNQKIYIFEISFLVNSKFILEECDLDSKYWKVVYLSFLKNIIYRHPILLSWEEITDTLYLNFIIRSVAEWLNQLYGKNYKLFTDFNEYKKNTTCMQVIIDHI